MARRQRRLARSYILCKVFFMFVGQHARIPCCHNVTTTVRVALDAVDYLLNLVDAFVVPVAPLCAINRAEVAVSVSPFIPNRNFMVVQIFDVCVAGNEPQQLINYRLQMYFFRSDKREAFREAKPHLMPENADGSGACTVAFLHSLVKDTLK